MKKIIYVLAVSLMFGLCGCGNSTGGENGTADGGQDTLRFGVPL